VNRLDIHGARGSYPIYDDRYRRYGGNTSCYSIETEQGVLIIDAGTGLTLLGESLAARPTLPPMTILLTHVHLDHIIGLPSFKPLLRTDGQITIMIEPTCSADWRGALMTLMAKPMWPVDLLRVGAHVRLEEFSRDTFHCYGLTITRCPVSHPQGGVSYRIATSGRTFVIATDREHGDPSQDRAFVEFAKDADVLLHDAQYTPEELPHRAGWGHSTWEQSARVAADIGAGSLVLVSHDPSRKDDEIDQLLEQARRLFPQTTAGMEGMSLSIGGLEPEPDPLPNPDAPLAIRYHFTFDGGQKKTFAAEYDLKTLELIQPVRAAYPDWTRLEYHKCPNCPLKEADYPRCPAATSLIDVVDFFNQSLSFEKVDVEVETKDRRFHKRCSLQEGIGSLIGIYMPMSGCPVMAKFKPMARFHLPFSSTEETFFRVLSMYLLAQYLLARRQRTPDWEAKDLVQLYRETLTVDTHFFKRLQRIVAEDAGLNAIIRLHSMANTIEFSLDQGMTEELERLFQAYLDGTGTPPVSSSA